MMVENLIVTTYWLMATKAIRMPTGVMATTTIQQWDSQVHFAMLEGTPVTSAQH